MFCRDDDRLGEGSGCGLQGKMVGAKGQSSKGNNAAWKDEGLIDCVFSWSLVDILNEDLYKTQVGKIPESFKSVKQYLGSYTFPLVEETRSELCSSLEVLSRAPFAKVTSIEASKLHRTLNVQVDYWRNKSTKLDQEPYKTLPGDIFIISDTKPESVADLQYPGRTWSLAWATKVSHNGYDSVLCIKLKAAKDIGVGDDIRKPLFVVYLANITPQNRIWRSLHFSGNPNIIKEVLGRSSVVEEICSQCRLSANAVCAERLGSLLPSTLNESQRLAVLSSLRKINCNHKCSVELIWGPPGTGKTKTVSILLSTILGIKCRVLTCAPTNVAITELASRVMKLLKESAETKSERGVSFCSLGDMLLFGTKERLKVGNDLEEVFLDYRVDRLKECFGITGWKHCLTSVTDFFQNCKFQYLGFLENELRETEGSKKGKSFLDFARERFKCTAPSLRRCIQILCTHIPKSFILEHNFQLMEDLDSSLDSFESLLSRENVISEELEELFSFPEVASGPRPPDLSAFKSAFLYWKSECLSVIRTLQISLDQLKLPSVMGKRTIKNFCFQRASLILCTTSSSYKLYSVKMKPFDLLVIDEAAQLKECESAIPLQLAGLRHAVLIGDEFQLPATVKSKVSDEAGFGRSLFERLSSLGHSKHLLNIQYRMHPSVSCFPNARFYKNKILDAPNVKSASYIRHYLPGPMFGPYSFINVNDGKEELDSIGHSRKNLVEVAVLIKIIHNLHKAWKDLKLKLSIGVISPYTAQVVAIKNKLGQRYEKCNGFTVKVKSIDGFQGGEEDIILISTVRCNSGGSIGFLANHQRANVVLTRARHCLWILGNGKTLAKSKSIWESVVTDAKSRSCFFNADEDKGLANSIIQVKEELLDFNDLLDKDSVIFRLAKWKVYFSSKFRESFWKLKHKTRKSIIFLLLKLSTGWRPKEYHNSISGSSSHMLKKIKVENMYMICTVDIEKDMKYVQILKVWDILCFEDIPILVQSLESIFKMYTDDFLDCSRTVCHQGESEVPMTWGTSHDVIRYKSLSFDSDTLSSSIAIEQSDVEGSKVIEILLLMKFCLLSYPVVSLMLSSHAGRDWDNLYQVSDQQLDIILSSKSTFLIGQPGSEKNTVLITKLFQRERQHYLCSEALQEEKSNEIEKKIDNALRQVFITATPRRCIAVKKQISYSQRMRSQQQDAAESDLVDMHDIDDILSSTDIPDSFIDNSSTSYPLVITLRKFLMMLDGSVGASYFDKFHELWKISHITSKNSSSALQTYIQMKEVDYDRFCSSYWPHFSNRLTRKLDAFTVFSEIIYSIKGSSQAGECIGGKLNRDDYVQLYKGYMSTLSKKIRDRIYDMFLEYEQRKLENGEYDLADLVIDLHSRLRLQNYEGDEIDFVYVDEVEMLTMRQIALLKYVCRNVTDGFVFSGDRAHTIARGNDFRFKDLRLLFDREFLGQARNDGTDEAAKVQHISKILHLSQNFHTHAGVLLLAQSVIDLIFRFFPQSIDILSAETSLLHGELPILVEPVKGENAIKTIFGNCNIGFGAQQVILVRDDATRKEIADLVGKQALILTIMECQGLEFQDVLLCNFFDSSPLNHQWEVIDEYMKEQDVLDIGLPMSYTTFGSGKQNSFCWELKQLFMAITRSTRRLWICETTSNLSNPIFEYWKKLSLVQVRQLNDSFVVEMKVSSSKEEWSSLGIKLYCEGYFGKSTMCFEKAEDKYRESRSKAAYLRIAADRLRGTEADMAHNCLRDAAELFGTIGMENQVAQCLIELNEYEKAGTYYLDKFGESRLEAAGDCYFIAGCYEDAAKVYARGQYFSKSLSVCSFAELFDIGFQIIKLHRDDFPDAKYDFLEKGALHYHELKDDKTMMKFVRAFESMDCKRTFLKTLGCFDNLLLLEKESGNFINAATIAKMKGDLLLEVDLLEKGGHWRDAAMLLVLHCIDNSLWRSGRRGWPLKPFKNRKKLLAQAKSCARNVSSIFYEVICTETSILSNQPTLFELKQMLTASQKQRNCRGILLSARRILDLHLEPNMSNYEWEDPLLSDPAMTSQRMALQNHLSVESLVYFWNLWKENIVNMLEYLPCLEIQDTDDYLSYGGFCLSYLGVRKQLSNEKWVYLMLNPDIDWGRKVGEGSPMDASQFISAALSYWHSEILSVGMKVLETLKAFYAFSVKKSFSVLCQSVTAIYFCEVMKFLEGFKFLESSNDDTLQNVFKLKSDFIQYCNHNANTETDEFQHVLLERCALHYHKLQNKRNMMVFVKKFHSMDSRRFFLKSLDCYDELLLLEEESGNYMEAAAIAREKGDLFVEVDLLQKAGQYKEAANLVMLYVLANSLWAEGSKGWPLKPFMQKEELLCKAKSLAKKSSEDFFYEKVCTEVNIISDEERTFHEMKQCFRTSQEHNSLIGPILSARKILDYHFNSDMSQYVWEDELFQESAAIFSQDKLSVGTLVYFWNCWKENVVTLMEFLETQNVKEHRYFEFCLNYFGVRKHLEGKDNIYHLLKPNADWVKSHNAELISLNAQQLETLALKYWCSEIFSVGLELLGTLSALSIFSVKNSSSLFSQSMIAVHIFQVAKFFTDSKFYIDSTQSEGMQDLVKLSTDVFFENVFSPDWTKSMTVNMIALRETGFSDDVLDEIIHDIIESKGEPRYRKMGRVLVVLFGHRKLPLKLYDEIGEVFLANPSWKALVNELKGDKIGLHHQLHDPLRDTYDGMWKQAYDYISPDCFLYILERQLVLELYSKGCFYATKSSFIEWFMYERTTNLRSDAALSSGDFWGRWVHKLLMSKSGVVEWLERSDKKSDESYKLLVLRLVVLMCLVCANTGKCFGMLFSMIADIGVSSKLPEGFFQVLQRRKRRARNFIHILAEALVEIKNPLVIVCKESQGQCGKFTCSNAIVVNTRNLQQREGVLKVMFEDHVTEVKSCSCRMGQAQSGNTPSFSSGATLVQQLKITSDDRDVEQANKSEQLKKAFDSQESSKVKQGKIIKCKNVSTKQCPQNIFKKKKKDTSAEVDCVTDQLKKLSVAFDMSNQGLKSKPEDKIASNKNKMKSLLQPNIEGSQRNCEPVKAKSRRQSLEDKKETSLHPQPKGGNREPVIVKSKKVVMKPKLLNPKQDEMKSSAQKPLQVWEAKTDSSSSSNCEQIKSKESRDLKNGEQLKTKVNSNSKPGKMLNAEGSGKNGEQVESKKDKMKKSLLQQVWEPKADGRGKNCEEIKSEESNGSKSNAVVGSKESPDSKTEPVKSLGAEGSGKHVGPSKKDDEMKNLLQQPHQVWEPKGNGRGKNCEQIKSEERPNAVVVSGKNVGSKESPDAKTEPVKIDEKKQLCKVM